MLGSSLIALVVLVQQNQIASRQLLIKPESQMFPSLESIALSQELAFWSMWQELRHPGNALLIRMEALS